MSPFMILAIVSALAVFAVVVFVAVVVGIRSEPCPQMATRPRGLLAALVRRLLGVYVARPTGTGTPEDNREECLTGSSTDWWNKGGGDR